MVLTYKQGLLAVSFLAAISSGCTYNEADLRPKRADSGAAIDRPPDLPTVSIETDADIPEDAQVDAEALDTGTTPDGPAGIAVDSMVGWPSPDADTDADIDAGVDARSDVLSTQPDLGMTFPPDANDDRPTIVLPADASDLPDIGIDAGADLSTVDARILDSGRIINLRIDGGFSGFDR